jgi:secondary thiamine-phosphate synthase enzyme
LRTELLEVDTSKARFVDLTGDVQRFARDVGGDGLLNVFVPHATAGLAVVETGSGTETDLEGALDRLLPRRDIYEHRHGSLGHGADHVLPAFLAPSLTLPVMDGAVTLGTWQSVVLVDLNQDNPHRKVRLSLII